MVYYSLISTAILLASTISSVSSMPQRLHARAPGKPHTIVYFGQSEKPKDAELIQLGEFCSKDKVTDTIVLGFVTHFEDPDHGMKYPVTNFAGYSGQNATGTGISMVPAWEKEIPACQKAGKRVLISVGGASGRQAVPKDVNKFAQNMAKMFGDDMSEPKIRPFGSAVVDGIDWDIEGEYDHPRYDEGWEELLKATRAVFKDKIFAAAPQCPPPDEKKGDRFMGHGINLVDEVYLQLYNNPDANCQGAKANQGLETWSKFLAKNAPQATLYAGFPGDASTKSASSGYLPHADMIKTVKAAFSLPNFNGVMTWEITTAMNNKDAKGKNYLEAMYEAVSDKSTGAPPTPTGVPPVPTGTRPPVPTGTSTRDAENDVPTGTFDFKEATKIITSAVQQANLPVNPAVINAFISELLK